MRVNEIIKESLEELRFENESDARNLVRQKLKGIVQQQRIIEDAVSAIQKLKVELKGITIEEVKVEL